MSSVIWNWTILRVIFVMVTVFVRGLLVRLTLTPVVVLFREAFLAAGDIEATGFATTTAAGFCRTTAVAAAGFLTLDLGLAVAFAALGLVLDAGFLEVGIAAITVEVKLQTEKAIQSVQVGSPSISAGLSSELSIKRAGLSSVEISLKLANTSACCCLSRK